MSRSTIFVSDALSAAGRALISQLPRGYYLQAWTVHASGVLPAPNKYVEYHPVSMDGLFELPTHASQAEHVIFVTDAFYKKTDPDQLSAWADVVRKSYDKCDDEHTKSFVFVSTAAVYADSPHSVSEYSECRPLSGAARVAMEVETYLVNASTNRALKPVILRIANPYGAMCPSIAYMLFQQAVVVATVRTTIPRLYKGPRCPLIHVDDVARAVYFLMERRDLSERVFNLSDDDCLRVGELFAAIGEAVGMPEFRHIVLPHAMSLPIVLRFLAGCGMASPIDRFFARVWEQVSYCYGLDPTLPPSLADFISASAWPRISSSRMRRLGFTPAHPSFRTSVGEIYRRMIEDHWLPDLSKPPCRPDALINRVFFRQKWDGFLVDSKAPNVSQKFMLMVDNDMPLWATHSFSEAPFHGSLCIGDRPQISFDGMRRVRHLSDVSTFDKAEFCLLVEGIEYTFRADGGGRSSFAPFQKFSLIDDRGRPRFTGKMVLDCSLRAILASFKSVTFQNR